MDASVDATLAELIARSERLRARSAALDLWSVDLYRRNGALLVRAAVVRARATATEMALQDMVRAERRAMDRPR